MRLNVAVVILSKLLELYIIEKQGKVRVARIMEHYGIPRSTFYRHLKSLSDCNILENVGHGFYQPSELMFDAIEEAKTNRQLKIPF